MGYRRRIVRIDGHVREGRDCSCGACVAALEHNAKPARETGLFVASKRSPTPETWDAGIASGGVYRIARVACCTYVSDGVFHVFTILRCTGYRLVVSRKG